MSKVSRRDFLKLAGLASGAAAVSALAPGWGSAQPAAPNVIILVLDAMSARNLSLYGYKRKTTPNFLKFAGRSTVYHNHRSGGNFTTPGTATLLTGTYPWTHRAFNISGLIDRQRVRHNIFAAFGQDYHRLAYSQNLLPNYFFGQFEQDLETILLPSAFSVVSQVTGEKFPRDLDGAYRAYDGFLFQDGTPPASAVFGLVDRMMLRSREARAQDDDYPRGLPRAGDHSIFFRLRDVFDGLDVTLQQLKTPYLAYLHLWAPHEPYRPTREFDSKFQDNYRAVNKPAHRFGDRTPNSRLNSRRQNYDEYIANVDAEFGRLLEALDARGALEDSYLVVTADHGQSFERGVEGHVTKLLYEPLTHIPLMISVPGQRAPQEVYSPTNHVDVLPTLLHLTSRPAAAWAEGKLLPGLGGAEDLERPTFSIEAKASRAYVPLKTATVAMVKGSHKMIYYTGYEPQDAFELYDLANDFEEMQDLYAARPALAGPMQEELLDTLSSANASYQRT